MLMFIIKFFFYYSIEAQELGFVLVVDGRLLSWSDVKMILRTAQEALPGQVHVAYIIQSNQFVQKQQISMGLSKEKDKVEFSVSCLCHENILLTELLEFYYDWF